MVNPYRFRPGGPTDRATLFTPQRRKIMANGSSATATPKAPNSVPEGRVRFFLPRSLKDIATKAIHDPTSNAYRITLKVVLVGILASIVVLAL